MLRALGDYAGLIVCPGRLYMERAISDPGDLSQRRGVAGDVRVTNTSPILGLLARSPCSRLCRQRWPGQRLRLFGALWFAVAFLPISNLFPLNAEVAEHWIYLASIGALLLLAGSVPRPPATGAGRRGGARGHGDRRARRPHRDAQRAIG